VTLWNGPTDRTAGRRTDLDDVEERLTKLVVFSRITAVEFVVGAIEYRDAERKA
jgi:hypothetical protein